MRSDNETLTTLAVHVLNNLNEANMVEFHAEQRAALLDKLCMELNVSFATDEDIKDQAIEEVQDKMGDDYLVDDVTETEIFNHARKEIIKSFQGENVGGLYLVESLHTAGGRIKDFLLNCDLVEDVFGTDEELVNFMVTKLRQFSPPKKAF
ncbi:MAG: hypothetical protein HOE90_20475 [Bacteriovoracaceae bacterium]|jgi:hypothetical protein|nr:hypothetical protein [Bacteriovoracaceae bacterium]